MACKIEYLTDSYECYACGCSWAEGYKIYKDDVLVIDKSPSAYCYSSMDHPQSEAAFDILKLEGIDVEVITNDEYY